MTVQRIPITSLDQWLELRTHDVTASDSGTVQNLHPYRTPLRLYLEKTGFELPKEKENQAMRRGRRFERNVAEEVQENHPEWQIVKATDYFRDPELRLGATPDYFISGDPRGLGVLQCKTVSFAVYERDWRTVERPPMWILVQIMQEMMLTEAAFGIVAAMVMIDPDHPVHEFPVDRHPATEQTIIRTVQKFWEDVAAGNEPDADYGLDRDLIAALSPKETKEKQIDLSTDNEVIHELKERAALKRVIKDCDDKCKEIETMIMSRMKDAERAIVPDFSVTWKTTHREGYTVKPSDKRMLMIRGKKSE